MSYKVLIVSAYPPDRGRLSEYAAALVEAIAGRFKIKVEVLSDSPPAPGTALKVYSVWRPDSVLGVFRLWFSMFKIRGQIVHFNLHLAVFGRGRLVNFLGLMTPAVARVAGKKVIVTLHNIPDMIRLESVSFKGSLLNRLGLLLAVKMVLRLSHRVVVTMKSYVKILESRYGAENVVYIPHGCWFTPAKPTWRWRGGGKILFLGYLAPYKDLDSLAEAVGVLSRKRSVKLLVSGGAHPNFSESIKLLDRVRGLPYVQYLGHVPDERLPELAEAVDLAVLPYKTNTGTSGVLHLLSGLGVPAVASDTPEFRELLSEGAGILLSSLDVPTLSSTIERLLDDRMLAESLSKKAVEFARERSWDRVAEKYVRLYESLR